LRLVALSVKLGGKVVLSEVGLELVRGLNVILGPNGSGKTTLLRCIIGMVKPVSGALELSDEHLEEVGGDHHTVGGKPKTERSYAPAEYFSAQMSVRDVLLSGGSKKDYSRYLAMFGLEGFLERSFHTLSTGEKRLVLVAKALAEGDMVLMDEPTSGLDLKNQAKLKQVISGQRGEKLLVVATHDIGLALLADRVTLLREGAVVAHGPPEEVLTEEVLSRVYEVRVRKLSVDGQTFFVT